jgi:hypothetical protein
MSEREALESMVHQFAHWDDKAGGYTTGGLSALEDAFHVLGWDDPHPYPEGRCHRCKRQGTIGTPTKDGYKWSCHEHAPKWTGAA